MFIPLHDANTLKYVKRQYVTLILIAVNVLIFLITATPQISDVQQANAIFFSYGFVPAVINDIAALPAEYVVLPEVASYLTYAFLHANFMHIAGNMLFLWVFGDNVEDAMGHWKFLVFYLLCAALDIGFGAHTFTSFSFVGIGRMDCLSSFQFSCFCRLRSILGSPFGRCTSWYCTHTDNEKSKCTAFRQKPARSWCFRSDS